jgi:transcriptional regulator with XRE-family HTH domain
MLTTHVNVDPHVGSRVRLRRALLGLSGEQLAGVVGVRAAAPALAVTLAIISSSSLGADARKGRQTV